MSIENRVFPVQFQADNENAEDGRCSVMCHVFDAKSQAVMLRVLSAQYRHVVAWDFESNKVESYDNR